jgi:hypothetical protein
MLDPSLLAAVMTHGSRLRTRLADNVVIERRRIGELRAPSGRIVACDPYYCDMTPFRNSIPPGRYPVEASLAHITSSEWCIALAILLIRQRVPVRWEPAEFDDGQSSYPVDSAAACFMDAVALPLLANKQAADEDFLNQQVGNPEAVAEAAVVVELDASTGANAVVFNPHDGTFQSFWGYDESGEVACLVTDFQVIDNRAELLPADQPTSVQASEETLGGTSGGTITVSPW